MVDVPERVLVIDIDSEVIRGMVLASGPQAVAGGYAQLNLSADIEPAEAATRIAAALDADAALRVVVTCAETQGATVAAETVAAIQAVGFEVVSLVERDEAQHRSNPAGGEPASLVDADIAAGLLTSHVGLTLGDLAAVVGAGLGVLGLGAPALVGDDATIDVWHPNAGATAGTGRVAEDGVDPETDSARAEVEPNEPVDVVERTVPIAVAGAAVLALGGIEAFSGGDEVVDDATLDAVGANVGADPAPVADAASLDAPPIADAQDPTIFPEDELTIDVPGATRVPEAEPVATAMVLPVDADGGSDATMAIDPEESAVGVAESADPALSAPRDQSAAAIPGSTDNAGKDSKRWRLLLGLLAAAAIVALLVSLLGGGDESVSTTATITETPTEVPANPAATAAPQPTVNPAPTVQAQPTQVPETSTPLEATATTEPTPQAEPGPTEDPLAGLVPLSSLPERGAIFRPPILYLEGPVQTQEQADALYQRAIEVVGPDNVVNEYVVRPDAPAAIDGNVRVEQAVLFESSSAAISEQFIPTLDLGVAVMALNPQVQMVVEGHTDSLGNEDLNQRLSETRAIAVVDYLVSKGVDINRLRPVGMGESAPVASNDDAAGRQINRRIEVELLDLLAAE